MYVYSSDPEYKSDCGERIFSICGESTQATASQKILTRKALPEAGTHLTPENIKFLQQLGFKLKNVENQK